MKEDFKKWLYKKAKFDYTKVIYRNPIEILIKAMWNINRGEDYITMEPNMISIHRIPKKEFFYAQYNNSEQQALEKALEYIFLKRRSK